MGFLPFFSPETWILLITFICLFVMYGYWTYGIFEKLGIPGRKPVMYWGTIGLNAVYYEDDLANAKTYGRVWGIYEFRKPLLAVMEPDMLRTILVKECFSYFTNRQNLRLNGELHDALSISEDDQWRRIRTVICSSFTSGRIKEMFGGMRHHSRRLTDSLRSKVLNEEVISIKSVFGPYSMDAMATCLFSIDMDTLNDPETPLITHASKLFKISVPLFIFQACFPIFLPLLELLGVSFFSESSIAYFRTLLEKILAERNSSHQVSVDFLQQMINSQTAKESKRDHENKGLTEHEIFSQAIIFLFAGFETSATTLSFLAYNLARNPDVMRRLQEEIDSTFPDKGSVQYEELIHMEYLDSVVSESLRLYPPIPRLDRVAKKTIQLNGITIPKGMPVMVPVYALHRDPELWPEPEEFKPDRFSKQNKQRINPYAYLPFGTGPRNCLGMRFALVMIKLALVEVLQSYSFLVCEETEIPVQLDPTGLLGPLRPLKLKMAARSET